MAPESLLMKNFIHKSQLLPEVGTRSDATIHRNVIWASSYWEWGRGSAGSES